MTGAQDGPYNVKAMEANLQSQVDWMKRIETLQLIQEWAKSEKAHSSPVFVNGIHQLRDLIAEQVADIRSSVSKEASHTIAVLANTMKDAAFDPLVDVFLATLLKALCITIEVIAQAADECIQSVLKSSRIGHYAAVPKLLEAYGSRNANLRKHIMEYFTLICNTWNPRSMNRHGVTNHLSKVLLQGLCDASGDVRAMSRKCFWALHAVHQRKALLVFEKLDNATKNKLMEEGGALDLTKLHAHPIEKNLTYNRSASFESRGDSLGEKNISLSRSSSMESRGDSVVARLYQPDYFQNRWQRLAKLKEARELRDCPFAPVIRKFKFKPLKSQGVPMLELDKLALQGPLRKCVSPVNA
ncbi:unnamed protein product [Aphanomyces euteiches]|uniref:TOG domain-containing protein n=1 Tax=Aphanomyces euteiches TaxID=100861 RepID=A0A6G0WR23_9STRA|nr:hypothetical protein Ae201684_012520 [Aphanomyces euteiches]KAH9090285.1 hypothetical protein Ae201684P_014092 [Aphanomyces euteiches]